MIEQLPLRAYCFLRINPKKGGSIFDLQSVAIYLFTRYGKEGRARFVEGMAIEATLIKQERRAFLRWLRHNGLAHLLVYDSGRRKGREEGRQEDGKDGIKPGRKGVPRVAQPERGGTAELFPPDEGF